MFERDTGHVIPVRIRAAATEPVQEVVDDLREQVARAEKGELRGLAYVGLLTDGATTYAIIGEAKGSEYPRTAGLLMWLANRCTDRWEELTPEVER